MNLVTMGMKPEWLDMGCSGALELGTDTGGLLDMGTRETLERIPGLYPSTIDIFLEFRGDIGYIDNRWFLISVDITREQRNILVTYLSL